VINNDERIKNIPTSKYKEIFGVEKFVFDRMLKILSISKAFSNPTNVGRKGRLSVLDCLVITLMYWREYRTYRHIAFDYGVGKTTIGNAVLWVENTLIASGVCNLKSARELRENTSKIKIAIVDVTEQEIERPKRGKKIGIPERKSVTQSKHSSL
jgi:hypothetical protein